MKLSKLLTLILFSFFIVAYLACKKSDSLSGSKTLSSERFFIVQPDAFKEIKTIANSVQKQNEKYHFVNALVKRIGYPRWDKAIISSKADRKTNKGSAGSDYDFVSIPFVRDSDNYVNSSLIVRYNATDTVYKLLYAQQYRNFGFDSSSTRWTANDVFNLFINFDNAIFGHTSFIVTDGRLGDKDSSQRLRASLNQSIGRASQKTSEWVTGEICRGYMFCIIVGPTQRTQNQKVQVIPDGCWQKDICTYFSFYVDDGGGSAGGTGGGGSSDPVGTIDNPGGTGGSSSTGGSTDPTQYPNSWWDYNACGTLVSPDVSCAQSPIGWLPVNGNGGYSADPNIDRWEAGYPISDDGVVVQYYQSNTGFWDELSSFNQNLGNGNVHEFSTTHLRTIGRARGWDVGVDAITFNRKVGKAFEETALKFYNLSENHTNWPAPQRALKNAPNPPTKVRPDAFDRYYVWFHDGAGNSHFGNIENTFAAEVKAYNGTLELSSNNWQILGELEVLRNNFDEQMAQPFWQQCDPPITINNARLVPTLFFITTDDTEIGQSIIDKATELKINVWQVKAIYDGTTNKVSFGGIKWIYDKSSRYSRGLPVPRTLLETILKGSSASEVPTQLVLTPGDNFDLDQEEVQ